MTNKSIILDYMLSNNLDPNKVILHTYETWKKLGYHVKRGEKSQHKIPVWKPSTKKVEVDNEDGTIEEKSNGRFFLKTASFFTQDQVERIDNNARNIQANT